MVDELKTRDQVLASDKWDLSSMYSCLEDWDKEFSEVEQSLTVLADYDGKLKDKEVVLNCLHDLYVNSRKLEKVYVYANLKSSEDLGNEEASLMLKRIQKLANDFGQSVAHIDPQLVKLDDSLLQEMELADEFAEYAMLLKGIRRSKQHVLSDKEEALMAKAGILWGDPYSIFSNFDNVDANFGKIEVSDGKLVQVTHGTYATLLENRDRNVRQRAFEATYKEFAAHINTLTEVLSSQVKQHQFKVDARGYESAMQKALFGNAIDPAVYKGLISRVHNGLEGFYSYIEKRRVMLGVEKIQMWDLRVPLLDVELKFTYDEAVDLVCAAAEPLGSEYVQIMRQGLSGGWVDRYENKGKRSGAFSSGCYDSWPYILMNFDGTLNDVFTLMHEAGHSMHTYLANQNQPYGLADYPIFTAEIASTVNERLLTAYLLENWGGDMEKAVRHYEIDAIRATFFRQTMFAEFELLIHEAVANGRPLTKDFLCDEYERLNSLYYGEGMTKDDYIKYEWARIPHFYYNFYVYQYATGIAAAYNFAEDILAGSASNYLNLLKSGGKDYPLELIKLAGVDMTNDGFYNSIIARFTDLVEGM